MRTVRLSKTALEQLNALLEQGVPVFGARVVAEKRDRLYDPVQDFLAVHPRAKKPHRRLKLRVYPIADTPFMVLYDFDDAELRVHFVLHRGAYLRDLDPASAEW